MPMVSTMYPKRVFVPFQSEYCIAASRIGTTYVPATQFINVATFCDWPETRTKGYYSRLDLWQSTRHVVAKIRYPGKANTAAARKSVQEFDVICAGVSATFTPVPRYINRTLRNRND